MEASSDFPSRKILVVVPQISALDKLAVVARGADEASSEGLISLGSCAAATVAAFVPSDMSVAIHDETLANLDFATDADCIAITANVSQARRAIEIANAFRARGKTVLMGGPHVSLAPHLFEDCADSIVVGELEGIAETVFDDLRAGCLKPRYDGSRPSLALSPMPRWDLYPRDSALMGVVQTSRGCPFECNFCDVIQYLGRNQRHKPIANVLAELQALYDLGFATVSLADDNLTVYRQHARTLLTAIAQWNGAEGREPVVLNTQLSIDLARDPDLIQLCVDAGMTTAFIGIESGSAEALTEALKRQNLRIDIREQCEKLTRAGLQIHAGLIVGFDSDDKTAFERQFDFAMRLPVPIFNINILVAPVATPLFDKMKAEGRILEDRAIAEMPVGGLASNFRLAQISDDEANIGARWLISRLLAPENFVKRLRHTCEILGPTRWAREGRARRAPPRRVQVLMGGAMRRMLRDFDGGLQVVKEAQRISRQRPEIQDRVQDIVSQYFDVVRTYRRNGIYDDKLAQLLQPPFSEDHNCAEPA